MKSEDMVLLYYIRERLFKKLKSSVIMWHRNLKVKKPLCFIKNYQLSLKEGATGKKVDFLFEILTKMSR